MFFIYFKGVRNMLGIGLAQNKHDTISDAYHVIVRPMKEKKIKINRKLLILIIFL
jgi:hypothetical protein